MRRYENVPIDKLIPYKNNSRTHRLLVICIATERKHIKKVLLLSML